MITFFFKATSKAPTILQSGLLFLLTFISSCSTMYTLNKLSRDNYTFVINGDDTCSFDKLFLDEHLEQNIEVDKKNKIVIIKSTGVQGRILSIGEVEKMYSRDSIKVAFIIFQGDLYGTSKNDEKIYFQYSLVEEIERIKKGALDGIWCNTPQGDVIIIK